MGGRATSIFISSLYPILFKFLNYSFPTPSQTKARIQATEDGKQQEMDMKDMKSPEEVAKIIEDIKVCKKPIESENLELLVADWVITSHVT